MAKKISEDDLKKLEGLPNIREAANKMWTARHAVQNMEQFAALYKLVCAGFFADDIQNQFDERMIHSESTQLLTPSQLPSTALSPPTTASSSRIASRIASRKRPFPDPSIDQEDDGTQTLNAKKNDSTKRQTSPKLYCSAHPHCKRTFSYEHWRKSHEREKCPFVTPSNKAKAEKWCSEYEMRQRQKEAQRGRGRAGRISGFSGPSTISNPASSSDALTEHRELGGSSSGLNLHGINSEIATPTSEQPLQPTSGGQRWPSDNTGAYGTPYSHFPILDLATSDTSATPYHPPINRSYSAEFTVPYQQVPPGHTHSFSDNETPYSSSPIDPAWPAR